MRRAILLLALAGCLGAQILGPVIFAPGHHSTCNGSLTTVSSLFSPNFMTSDTVPSPFVVTASNEAQSGSSVFSSNAGASNSWLATGGGVAWLQIDLGAGNAQIPASYAMQNLASSAPARMPKNFTLQGSNNGSAWTVLDTRTNQTSWANSETRTFTISGVSTAYRYFKLDVTANNGDGTWTQFANLSFYTTVTNSFAPVNMTANNAPSPFVASASTVFPGFDPFKAFDGISTSVWAATGAPPQFLKIDLGSTTKCQLHSYTIQFFDSGARARAPAAFTVAGSNDDSSYTTLDSETSQTGWGMLRSYPASGATQYRYFKLNITAIQGGGDLPSITGLFLQ